MTCEKLALASNENPMPDLPPVHRLPGAAQAHEQSRKDHDRARADLPQRRLLNTQRYRRFRLWRLVQHPVCQDCARAAADTIHHVRGLAEHPEDLCDGEHTMCLCKPCHDRRTARGE